MNDVLGLVVHHFDDHFNERLETTRHACGSAMRCDDHESQTNHAHQHRPENCIEIDDAEVNYFFLVLRGEMTQVVNDVLGSGWRMRRSFYCRFCCHVSA